MWALWERRAWRQWETRMCDSTTDVGSAERAGDMREAGRVSALRPRATGREVRVRE